MTIGLIVIGDEILSGKRQDQHFPKVVEILAKRGLELGWVTYLGDDRDRLIPAFKQTFMSGDIVFSCGGIGATPDDHTRQSAATALDVPLVLHPQAKEKIQERIAELAIKEGQPVDLESADNQRRLKMGEFPHGAAIIPNPVNNIPGFSVLRGKRAMHHFVPGFPAMAWPMIEWALDTYHADLFHQATRKEASVMAFDVAESSLTPLMESIETQFPEVKVFSLPNLGDSQTRRHIELGVKGTTDQVEQAFQHLLNTLDELHVHYVHVVPKSF